MSEVENLLKRHLSPYGFKKKGRKWFLYGNEAICEIHLEKDRFRNDQFHLGFRVWLLQISSAGMQKRICDISGDRYSPNVQDFVELQNCLSSKYSIVSDEPRIIRLNKICSEKFIPFVLSLQTLSGIKDAYLTGKLLAVFVSKELKKLLAEIALKNN